MATLDEFVDVLSNGAILVAKLDGTLQEIPLKRHAELLREAERFHDILGIRGEIPVMPPELAFDDYHAVPVKVQDGCGGPCTFCSFYDRKIRVVHLEDVYKQIDMMADYLREELDHFHKVVLLQGDALTVPSQQLGKALQYARERFGIGEGGFAHAFAKAKTVSGKPLEELVYLGEQGLLNVNMGLESGCQELLDLVKPGQTLKDFREAVTKLRTAKINVSVNVIAGLGGKLFSARHVEDTLNFVRSLPEGVTVFYAPLEVDAARYVKQEEQLFGRLEPSDLIRQADIFRKALGAYRYMFIPM